MPTYIVKGVKCTLKDGVVKLATDYCYLCNGMKTRLHHHQCKYCGFRIDELESNIMHFAYASYGSWRANKERWFAHSKCYKGKKGSPKDYGKQRTVYIINHKDKT